jgi:glycosyltransferase involved in cell wall biosynthesis
LPDPFYESLPADVMLAFGVNAVSATVIASAGARGSPSLLFLESDADLDARHTPGSDYVNPYGERGDVCAYVLRETTAIVAQSPRQQHMLRERFGRDAVVLPNPIDVDDWRRRAGLASRARAALPDRYALWIGRFDRFHKRPLELLNVARICPEVSFVMVLAGGEADVERELRAECSPNVRMVPSVPFEEMPAVMAGARLLVSTSSAAFEGAPNVFLQAATLGLPIASLEADPGLMAAAGCGATTAADPVRLADLVRRLWVDDALHQQWAVNGRRYAETTHDAGVIARDLRAMVGSLVGQ